MSELKIFENSELGKVRTAIVNNKPMFCLSDVCKVLEITHVTDVKNRLKDGGVINEVIDNLGRKQLKSKEHYLFNAIIGQTFMEDEHGGIVTGEAV